MAERLVASCRRQGRPLADCEPSLIAYELDDLSAERAREAIIHVLRAEGVASPTARTLAASWVRSGDYLFDAFHLSVADYVIGNPPYIRLEEIPSETAGLYRDAYPTMRGRADVYVAFFEAGLRQLKPNGVCVFICADRWMRNQYGAELRRLVTRGYSVEVILEMHNANPFDDDVSAYPAISIIRRGRQGRAVVASANHGVEALGGGGIATRLQAVAQGAPGGSANGLTTAVVEGWFSGSDPWPCTSPTRLALLRRLEEQFEPLESELTGTKVGIGVATGLDEVFITDDANLVEDRRLLPLALAQDTASGNLQWSGHFVVNPWDADGLVRLDDYPRLHSYFKAHETSIKRRNTAQKNPAGWYRTIDRINPSLTTRYKLYIPDIKERFNPVLDKGETYPHHNLYYICSTTWDLEVLGGLLLSKVGQFFVESYGVRMRGGYLRFQAQYLRRIRVPRPDAISQLQAERLVEAFRSRDRELASQMALEIYRVDASELNDGH